MRIHRGAFRGCPATWIEPRTTWQFGLEELVDGLCSCYIRNWVPGDDPWPGSLPLARIVEAVKEEFEHYGSNAVWTWSEQMACTEYHPDEHRLWARRLVLAHLPALDPTTTKPSAPV